MTQKELESIFLKVLNTSIVRHYKDDYDGDYTKFRPSALSDCNRKLYYSFTNPKKEPNKSPELIGILESGTFRHEVLQKYIQKMDNVRWVNVYDYLTANNITDVKVIKKNGYETRCLNTKYNISFSVDGLLEINGEYYLLEIKTETTFKFKKHTEPWFKHTIQADTYCLCLGLNNVIFLYENRDLCNKKVLYYNSTEESREYVLNKMHKITKALNEKKTPEMTKDKSKCKYCHYHKECRSDNDA